MKKVILFFACFIWVFLTMSYFHIGKSLATDPIPIPETMPTEAMAAQAPVPTPDPMPEATPVPAPELTPEAAQVPAPEPDTIDYVNAYSSVIEKYRIAKQANVSSPGAAYEYGVSEMIEYHDHVGYALKDLDENGIPELIVAGIGSTLYTDPILFDVYTLENYTPVQLLSSWARSRNYLLPDNRIYNEGSSGAASSGFILYKVSGATLQSLEGYWSSNSTDFSGSRMYHTTTNEGRLGIDDFDNYDYTMPAQQGYDLMQQLRETACLPELTLIA